MLTHAVVNCVQSGGEGVLGVFAQLATVDDASLGRVLAANYRSMLVVVVVETAECRKRLEALVSKHRCSASTNPQACWNRRAACGTSASDAGCCDSGLSCLLWLVYGACHSRLGRDLQREQEEGIWLDGGMAGTAQVVDAGCVVHGPCGQVRPGHALGGARLAAGGPPGQEPADCRLRRVGPAHPPGPAAHQGHQRQQAR